MTLGEYIKSFRDKYDVSMDKFAEMSGLSKSYVGVLEKGINYKTGEPIQPSIPVIKKVADATGVDFQELFNSIEGLITAKSPKATSQVYKVPVLGKVVAGLPISAYEDILGFEEITPEMAAQGEHYALRVTGDSMYPQICDGDIVLVRVQSDVESEDVAVVFVNGDEATLKKVKKDDKGITIYGFNSAVYEPHFFTNEEIEKLPITISGKVVELRRSF